VSNLFEPNNRFLQSPDRTLTINWKQRNHRLRPVARFHGLRGRNTFSGGQDFCFHHTFKADFSWNNKIGGGTNKIWEDLSPNVPVATGLRPPYDLSDVRL